MRVISQDGKFDFPYEISSVVRNGNEIIVRPFYADLVPVRFAKYSTEEKTKKAMEMLRIAYAGKFITTANLPDDFDGRLKEMMKHGFGAVLVKETDDCKAEFNNLNGYFIFPKDDEI